MELRIKASKRLLGCIQAPGDKSISHRALLFAALAGGETLVEGFLPGEDCWSTANCLKALGVSITREGPTTLRVSGVGPAGLREPEAILDAGNSGTTMRLLLGILAGQPFYSVLSGDDSLRRRPMARVADPLREMGAQIWGRDGGSRAPLSIIGSRELRALEYRLPVASAQLKSALLLAGLQTEGVTSLSEPAPSRDHTERMLAAFGAQIYSQDGWIKLIGPGRLMGLHVEVPGDFSAAAFFLVAALLVPESRIDLAGVGVNPTRTGLLEVLRSMGAEITVGNVREKSGEPVADLTASFGPLRATEVAGQLIPRLIDEVPILAVAATQAEGTTIIRDASELAVKETNRLAAMAEELGRMGARIEASSDGLIIEGPVKLRGASCYSHGDHRVAMSLAVAGLVAQGETVIHGAECTAISFPNFPGQLAALMKGGL